MSDTISAVVPLLGVAVIVLLIASGWKIFTKAGEAGWAVLVPIYNGYIFLKIAGKPGWWLLLFLVPVVNMIVSMVACAALAKRFGKGTGYTAGMVLLPFVFYPMLGFGDARYSVARSS